MQMPLEFRKLRRTLLTSNLVISDYTPGALQNRRIENCKNSHLISSGVTDRGQGGEPPPGKLNAKIGLCFACICVVI